MSLINALNKTGRSKSEEQTAQFDGIKLAKEDVAELYEVLGLESGSPGSEAFELMIEQVTGIASPNRESKSSDGSKFIGKKLSIVEPTEKDTVYTNHVVLCQKLGLPANSSGAVVFRHMLANLPAVKEQIAKSGK